MTFIYVMVWISLFACVLIYLYKFGLSHLYDYRVGQDGVEFIFLTFLQVFTVKFASIESAREIRLFTSIDNKPSSIFTCLVIGNRLAAGLVVLKMKAGPFQYIALTPADRETFVQEVAGHLSTKN